MGNLPGYVLVIAGTLAAAILCVLLHYEGLFRMERRFRAGAAWAASRGRAGQAVGCGPDGRPVAWREALLHRLVLAQKIDARGDGYWRDPQAADPDADAACATAHALRALRRALGE